MLYSLSPGSFRGVLTEEKKSKTVENVISQFVTFVLYGGETEYYHKNGINKRTIRLRMYLSLFKINPLVVDS